VDEPETRRIVVLDAGYDSYALEREAAARVGATLEVFDGDMHDREGRIAFAQGAVGVYVRWTEVDAEFLDAVPGVEALLRYGIGYDNVDLAAASARGVCVSNVQGYASHSASDHALALILACVRGLRMGMGQIRSHYTASPRPHLPELKDMTLGIVGLGRIGGTLCTKTQSLFRRILACDPYIPAERFTSLGATACDLPALLGESDVVSIHCNLTEETRRMFDADALAHMRPTAILVNTARGPVVDEAALTEALQAERLFAAGLDVYCDEPPLSNRDALLEHPHVVPTGHYAWFSTAASEELQRRAAENMETTLRGELPEDCLNPEAFR